MRTIDAAISAPDSSGIVVCGAPGVGKRRSARGAPAAAESAGFVTRWAIGSAPARALPLGAFAPWVEPTASGGAQLVQLVRSVVRELTLAPPNKSVVVGVDDVHLLDDLSTFVLHQIVQRGAAKVVLTLREGELIT